MSKHDKDNVIPDIIHDGNTGKSYIKGRFFGKGGFAKCYEIKESKSHHVFAGKIVPKSILTKVNQRDKMTQEIHIHQSLTHRHIVGFHGFFEDIQNIYIILELCRKRSMMELHKRRKALTECETRYYMKQILDGVAYLHKNKIIHRDLKLGNLFLDDELQVKIGDFGLATKLEHDGERKKTLCGTPNYIAPEILMKSGHSYEVDIWSIGCIMYTLLVGKPPFETSSLRETYARIKQVQYKTPAFLSKAAMNMIANMLQGNPTKRPSVNKLIKDVFFTSGFLPTSLPISCLTMAPRMDALEMHNQRKPLTEMNGNGCGDINDVLFRVPQSPALKGKGIEMSEEKKLGLDIKKMLLTLKEQLATVLKTKPAVDLIAFGDEMTDPDAQPFVWISKWVDYSDKYGFGYQLSDEGVGVMYNDGTRLIMLANGFNVHYINREGSEEYHTVKDYPGHLDKKMKLLNYFQRYMNEHLMKAGGSVAVKQSDSMSRIPYMHQWFRTQSAVVMQLTNGSVQINFLDHTKIIMCPLMAAVTYIDSEKNFRTFRFQTIQQHGCTSGLAKNLAYAHEKVGFMLVTPQSR
ncbi:serine/threonine-protein kinase polo [Neodiprion pinetum]|uniref:polo kinase n=1 Tax=Neodiprion lecontei TaxID=441921 RepID=A0A6J0BRN0_NEOLC|nr:serine/threonine-protein kinase polo [Neodiprion lecontei]XP_046420876.1 serine/threonine-protein kinase polo [Neodiprion fabricii]XP_046478905.1 serine/threonine-protein kinase polo [Neodiprion pinetum]XP_046616507.1 serine/threonine-protein kinase polo [Neodiprion virginianus]